jgi:hypothetical protein
LRNANTAEILDLITSFVDSTIAHRSPPPNLSQIFNKSIMTSADHASQETNTLLPMSTSISSPAWRSNKLLWAALAAAGVALSVVVVRSTSTPFSQRYENPAARDFDYDESEHKVVVVELEGKKHKLKDQKESLSCQDGGYSKRTLKLAYELPFASLFRDTKGQRKYEASSVVLVDDYAYAVCDSSWAISKFGAQLQPFADTNVQVSSSRQ